MADNELDVRQLRKPDKHPTIFATYAALPAGGSFVLVNNHDPKHTGPDLDVLTHALSGSGRLTTETGTIDLSPGALLWLPQRSRRQFTAGPDGSRYLTVHQRRQALVLRPLNSPKPPAQQAI